MTKSPKGVLEGKMTDLERAALADLTEVHRGWCNYCKGNAKWCIETRCSLARYLKAISPAPPAGEAKDSREH